MMGVLKILEDVSFSLVCGFADDNGAFYVKVAVNGGKRGVYLRQPEEVSKKTQWSVTVNPVLHDDVHNDRRVSISLGRVHYSPRNRVGF